MLFLFGPLIDALIVFIIFFVIYLLISALFLKIGLGIVSAKHTNFGAAFVTALICAIVIGVILIFVPLLGMFWLTIIALIIGAIICLFIISRRHDINFLKSLGAAILAIVIGLIVTIIIAAVILGLIGLALWFWP